MSMKLKTGTSFRTTCFSMERGEMKMTTKLLVLAGFGAGVLAGAWGKSDFISGASARAHVDCRQKYPNIPGRVLLEDNKMVVQRFTFPPGQWEGVHAHPPHQLYIQLTDAHWKVRFGDRVTSGYSPAGSVGFYGPVELSEDHESINIGQNPVDLIWVTLKEDCVG